MLQVREDVSRRDLIAKVRGLEPAAETVDHRARCLVDGCKQVLGRRHSGVVSFRDQIWQWQLIQTGTTDTQTGRTEGWGVCLSTPPDGDGPGSNAP